MYVYKGTDQITISLQNPNDEIAKYLSCRYISPCEAVYRLMNYPTNDQWPPVKSLAVHLPNAQDVYFSDKTDTIGAQNALLNSRTTLTEFFALNQEDERARSLLFQDIPKYYTWDDRARAWKRRKQGFSIGRMIFADPVSGGERYFLRLLLTHVKGPRSYKELRTVEGYVHATFKAACTALGLLQDDKYWEEAMREASSFQTGHQLRSFFVVGMIFGEMVNPVAIWEQFCEQLCDDLRRRIIGRYDYPPSLENPHLDYGLWLLKQKVLEFGEQHEPLLQPFPPVRFDWGSAELNRLLQEQLDYDPATEAVARDEVCAQFNNDQRAAFGTIVDKIERDPINAHFFLHGWGGTGKTFLYKGLCHHFRSQRKIVLCVASSGIAALLLPGGRTAHSRFKIPLDVMPDLVCKISKGTQLGKLIEKTSLIIWDEVPMQHRFCLEAVHTTLCDLRGSDSQTVPFGGIPCVFGGDFAQILPVVRHGSRAETVNAAFNSSRLWKRLELLFLRENMRVRTADDDNRRFVEWQRSLSYKKEMDGIIELPDYISQTEDIQRLYNEIFPPALLQRAASDFETFRSSAILACHNASVNEVNAILLGQLPGSAREYASVNIVDTDGMDQMQIPADEVLQAVDLSDSTAWQTDAEGRGAGDSDPKHCARSGAL